MKRLLIIGLTLLFCWISVNAVANPTVRKYINQYKELRQQLSKQYGIPVSILTAISIVESGAGKSRNCRLLNNHFGIIGKNNLKRTKGIKSRFKQYASAEDSYKDFCKMVTRKKYYTTLKGTTDYKKWVEAMAKAGYSTTPAVWKKEITATIKNYKLYLLDDDNA